MTDDIKRFALPGDIVQLDGTKRRGTVLDWSAQLAIDRREMEKTHYPIGSEVADPKQRAVAFWPQAQVTVITRHTPPPPRYDPFDDPIRF